jgi:hypothetical protein
MEPVRRTKVAMMTNLFKSDLSHSLTKREVMQGSARMM